MQVADLISPRPLHHGRGRHHQLTPVDATGTYYQLICRRISCCEFVKYGILRIKENKDKMRAFEDAYLNKFIDDCMNDIAHSMCFDISGKL